MGTRSAPAATPTGRATLPRSGSQWIRCDNPHQSAPMVTSCNTRCRVGAGFRSECRSCPHGSMIRQYSARVSRALGRLCITGAPGLARSRRRAGPTARVPPQCGALEPRVGHDVVCDAAGLRFNRHTAKPRCVAGKVGTPPRFPQLTSVWCRHGRQPSPPIPGARRRM
jgi:hypothetical protein